MLRKIAFPIGFTKKSIEDWLKKNKLNKPVRTSANGRILTMTKLSDKDIKYGNNTTLKETKDGVYLIYDKK